MRTTKVFKSGNSQAVRIPAEYQFDTDKVEIFRRDDELVLRKKAKSPEQSFPSTMEKPASTCKQATDRLEIAIHG